MNRVDNSERPNIVLMVADDHGLEALGCYGNSIIDTPNLDALAAEGVRFTNACCTTASCAASRSAILTGLQNHTNGTYGHTHRMHHFSCFDNVVTLPARLRDGGYRTGRVGKQHYAPVSLFPWDWERPAGEAGRDDIRMSETCREFVRGNDGQEEPFFLYWCSHNPHRKTVVETHPLRPNDFGNPAEPFPNDTERIYSPDEVVVPFFLSDTPEVRAELAQYYQSISRLDRGIGHLMQVLEEEGKRENTVIMYLSDNGPAFPEAKTTLYEPGMHLPLIVSSPLHSKRGTACDGLINWTDLTPTILDFAGIDAPADEFHGKSFRGIIDEESPENWRDVLFAAHTFHEITNYYPMRVLRTKRHKFIYNIAWKLDYSFAVDLWRSACWQAALREGHSHFGSRSIDAYIHRPRFELYDLESDPEELNNLADDPKHKELLDSFIQQVQEFQRDTKDPWIHKWEFE